MIDMNTWIDLYLEEKQLPETEWNFELAGTLHFIDSIRVIQLIKESSKAEQAIVKNALIRIDFANGNVLNYLKHLAFCYLQENYQGVLK